jgi:uncharacterized protein (DUF488 family)
MPQQHRIDDPPVVLTIGHSNRTLDEFVAILRAHDVRRVVDVRTVPRSRHNPQYNVDALPASLEAHGIAHTHMPGLGGLRKTRPDSANAGWRNLSFRGYADYMQTEAFGTHLDAFIELATRERCALMCAEAVPWRCHRSLIGDALIVRGFDVQDIYGMQPTRPHKLTPFARVDGTQVTYPALEI